MEDEVIMEFLASEFVSEKKRLPEGVEIDALAIGFQAGTKLMNQLIEANVLTDKRSLYFCTASLVLFFFSFLQPLDALNVILIATSITAPAAHISLITFDIYLPILYGSIINTLMNLYSGLAPDCFLLYIYM